MPDIDSLVDKFSNQIKNPELSAKLAIEALKNNEEKMENLSSSFVKQQDNVNSEELDLYKKMAIQPVESSNIEGLSYLKESKILKIRFTGGGEYIYKNVEELQYKNIMNAKSIGRYFNDNIKAFPEKYQFIKL